MARWKPHLGNTGWWTRLINLSVRAAKSNTIRSQIPPPHYTTGVTDETIPEEARSLQGLDVKSDDSQVLAEAIEQAFDYRGDVTIETRDGRSIEGYLYDRVAKGDAPRLRIMPAEGSARLTIPYADVTRVAFTGKDPAWGKSWEAWVRKHEKLKARGQAANLESDPLDEDDASPISTGSTPADGHCEKHNG